MKKIIAGLMATVLVFGAASVLPAQSNVFGTAAIVASAESTEGNYSYDILEDGTARITKYNGSEENLTLPATLGGKKVTTVGENAFQFNRSIITLTVPDGYTTLESHAFFCCRSLDNVTLPNSLTYVGNSCFWGCESLRKCHIPDSVTHFDALVFSKCNNLTDVTLPSGLTVLPGYTFHQCTSLTKLEIPEGVTVIEPMALVDCDKLKNLTIPANAKLEERSVALSTKRNDDGSAELVPTAGVTLYVAAGSQAETYCKNNNIAYKTDGSMPQGTPGDVNGDGKIDVTDLSKVAAHIKSIKTLTDSEMAMADASNDGKIDVTDLSKIAAHIKSIKSLT